MASSLFEGVYNRFKKRKLVVGCCMVALLLASIAGLFRIPLEHSLDTMLPTGSKGRDAIQFLNEIDFSAKVLLSFSSASESLTRSEMLAEIDALTASIDSPLVPNILNTFDQKDALRDVGFFLQCAPDLFEEADRIQLAAQLAPDQVAAALRARYVQLLKPEGAFLGAMIQRDPLNMQMPVVGKLRALSSSFGYDMRIEDGHIVSKDGDHVLLVLETTVRFTDGTKSKELLAMLGEKMAALPETIAVDMICGHLHTIENESVIRRDIASTISIAGVAFVLLFLFFFKDARANLVFLLPFAALPIAVNLAALFCGTLSLMMLGFGAVIAGITVDYAIHVYVAVRRGGDVQASVSSIIRPILLGAATTGSVFAAFLVSSIPGYHQLACFALFSVVVAVAMALFILPLYIIPGSLPEVRSVSMGLKQSHLSILLFCIVVIACLPLASRVRFDSDIKRLDGVSDKVLEAERHFHEIWGDGEAGQSIVAVGAPDFAQALALNDRLYDHLSAEIDRSELVNLATIWRSDARRSENLKRWQSFWDDERLVRLKALFDEKGQPYGFTRDAFAPFFESLQSPREITPYPEGNAIFDQLESRFVQVSGARTWLLTFLPDTPANLDAVESARSLFPEYVVVSQKSLSSVLSRDYTREFTRIGIVALLLVLLTVVCLLRDFRKVFIVLLPALSGLLGVVMLSVAIGVPLNVMNLVSGVVVIGLCIDYGIFHVHAYTNGLNVGTRSAITLSAGTTLIGAAALLFARHPALFSVGVTLVGGIAAGYVVAMVVVPALCELWLEVRS